LLAHRKLFFLLFFVLFAFSTMAQARDKEIEIKSITIKGNARIDAMTILSNLSLKEGDVFSPERVQDDVRSLYRMGFFEEVEVSSEGFEGGIALSFIVREKPLLSDVIFEGNDNLEKDRLNEALQIRTQGFLETQNIKRYVKQIEAAYEAEAYYNATVIPVVQRVSDNQAILTFLIEEGDQVYIRDITITGNAVFESKKIRKQMETDSYFWMSSWITESGRYKKEQLSFDRERIKDLYLDNGYFDIEVGEPEVTLSENKEWFDIALTLNEGEQFSIGIIDYQGAVVFDSEALSALAQSKTDDVFNRSKIREDIAAITEHYGQKGYIYTNVVPDLRPNAGNRTLDITFHVVEGDPVKVREILISGNNKTRDKVIRREIRVSEQELVDTKALRRSFQRLNNLNYFESVDLVPKRVAPGWVDLEVEVKEKPTGTFSVGGGYSSQDKFIATFDVTMGNFLGKGQLLKFKVATGGRRDTYTLTFKEPYLFDKNLSGTTNLFNQRRDFGVYEEKRTGGDLILGKAFGEYVRGSISYTLETQEISDLDQVTTVTKQTDPITGAPITDPDTGEQLTVSTVGPDSRIPLRVLAQEKLGDTLTSAIGFSLSRDTRDFFFDPKEGGRNSISFEYAGTVLGGDNDYYKVIADSSRFFPLWWEHVFSLHGRFGFAEGIGEKELPVGERFYVGGINTVRGFEFGEAGPLSSPSNIAIRGEPEGGNKQLFFNLEYLIPIVKEAKVKFLFFYDYGAAFREGDAIEPNEMREAAGIGLRWISPVGPLRLEQGYNINKRPGEKKKTIEFSIGSLF